MYFYIVGDIAVYRINKKVVINDKTNWYENEEVDLSDSALEDWMINNMNFEDLEAEFIGYRKEDYNKYATWEIRNTFDETKLDKKREYTL